MSNNEIAVQQGEINPGASLEVLPPRQPVAATARQVLKDHAEMAGMAYEFATKLVGTSMVPDRFRNKAEDATAAILYGAELGLGPIQALQNVFAVHGTPAVYARTMQGLLERRGFRFKTITSTGTECTVVGLRPDTASTWDDPDEDATWTIGDVEQAGWMPTIDPDTGKYRTNLKGNLIGNEKYLTQPREMLYAKAVTSVCRKLSPATLLGISYSVEDLESETPISSAPAGPVKAAVPAEDPLTVDEILSAAPDTATATTGTTSRVEAALAAARAANPPSKPKVKAPEPETEPGVREDKVAASVVAAALREQLIDPEPEPEPAQPEPQPEPEPEPASEPELKQEPEPEPEAQVMPPKRDERPATKAQLSDLQELIALAGFQPTPSGREEWFAWLSQEVDRAVTANNQLKRWEIVEVIDTMNRDGSS